MLKESWLKKSVIGLLVVLNALFLYYWVTLAANYCLHFDDAHFMWKLRDSSILDYVREMYMSTGGNFVSYFLNGIIFTISGWLGAYRFWAILFYALGVFMTWAAFRDMPWMKHSGYKGWLGVLTLYNVYILTSVDLAVFTWMCAMEYYLFAPALCLLVKYISKDSLNWRQWIGLVLLAIFISGNAVSISTITFVVLFVYGMWMWYKEGWNIRNTWAQPQVRRLIGITILMLAVFAVVFVAPGNWARMADETDIEHPKNIMEFAKAICVCIGMFMYLMVFYLPYHLIAIAIGAWAGSKFPMSLQISRNKAIGLAVLVFIIYLVISVVPLAYLSNGFQIQRNYIQIGFFYMLMFFVLGYIWSSGRKTDVLWADVDVWMYRCINVCSLFLIAIMCLNIKQDLPVARAYNKAHQERESYLLRLQENGQIESVVVTPYPTTQTPDAKYNVLRMIGKKTSMQAIYYEADTDVDPNEYEEHVRRLLKIDFDFVLTEIKE